MKQHEIDRWANRQARMNRQATLPTINWALIATLLVVLIVILRVAHIL